MTHIYRVNPGIDYDAIESKTDQELKDWVINHLKNAVDGKMEQYRLELDKYNFIVTLLEDRLSNDESNQFYDECEAYLELLR